MLTRKTPETFKAILNVKALGESQTLVLTFYNRTTADLTDALEANAKQEMPEDIKNPAAWVNAQALLYMIKSFDDGTDAEFPLTLDGLLHMESVYPGVLMGLTEQYHICRRASVEKN